MPLVISYLIRSHGSMTNDRIIVQIPLHEMTIHSSVQTNEYNYYSTNITITSSEEAVPVAG
jgi:hypothetical protein